MARIYLGNVKGPKGDTGATGATGPQGNAATVNVGSVSTTAYGNAAQVTNVGTENDAILNFVIPQGKPGEKTTTMSGLTLDTVTTSADEFPVPAVSENGSTVWGKVIKFFQDTVAALTGKLDANKIVNSQAVTEAGYGLDALQANPSVSGSLAAQISDLNDSLANYIVVEAAASKHASVTINNITAIYFTGLHICFLSFNISLTATVSHNSILFTLPDTIQNALKAGYNTSLSYVNGTSIAGRAVVSGRNVNAFGSLAVGNYLMGSIVYPTY